MSSPFYVYTCGVDYQHEIDAIETSVYPSIESLKHHRKCWIQCGIVRLRVELDEWVEPQKGWHETEEEETECV